MKQLYRKGALASLLGVSLVAAGSAGAVEVVWHQADLVNNPITTQLGDRSSTNVSYANGMPLMDDGFPRANVESSTGDYSLTAEVGVGHATPNSVTTTTNSNVTWTTPPMIGAWSNANAYLYAGFELRDPTATGSLEKSVTVTLSGDYQNYSVDLDDGVAPVQLTEGANRMTLALNHPYYVNAHLYSFTDSTNNNGVAGSRTAAANMTISIDDVPAACHLNVTANYLQRMLTVNYEYSTSEPATLRSWLTNGSKTRLLLEKELGVVDPAETDSVTSRVGKRGTVGIATTLSTAGQGVICSDWQLVDTGPAQ